MRVTLKFSDDEEVAILKLAGDRTPYSLLKSIISAHLAGTTTTPAAPQPEVKTDPGQQDLMPAPAQELAESSRGRMAGDEKIGALSSLIGKLILSQNAILASQRKLDAAVTFMQKELSE